jgi:hypothetical protein
MNTQPFYTHNDYQINLNGTCLQAKLHNLPYATLVDVLGEPSKHYDDYKSDAEWQIEFPDGQVACIYNWKDGKNYCGPEGKDVRDITSWHIGGQSHDIVYRIHQLLSKAAIAYC